MNINKAEILRALDISTYYKAELGTELKAGNNGRAMTLCPFHDDHDPSFSLNLETGAWKCFAGCGGGSVFDFHTRKHGVGFHDAKAELARMAGISGSNGNGNGQGAGAKQQGSKPGSETQRGTPDYLAAMWKRHQASEIPEKAMAYLQGRAVDGILSFLRDHGRIGYDAEHQAIVFPMHTHAGELVGLQRIPTNGGPKMAVKGSNMREGFFILPGAEDEKGFVVSEGAVDALSIRQCTEKTTLATLSASTTDKVRALGQDIILFMDRDQAGETATRKICEAIPTARVVNWKLAPGNCKDPNDLYRGGHIETISRMIETASRPAVEEPTSQDESLLPLTPESTRVRGRLIVAPTIPDPLLWIGDQPFLPRSLVSALYATGGVGKTFFLLLLLKILTTPMQSTPIRATRPTSVLYVNAEDPDVEMDRRLWEQFGPDAPPGLHVAAMAGRIGAITQLCQSTPQRTKWFNWLDESIRNHPDVELVILDTKSRFDDLPENANESGAYFVRALEALSQRNRGVGILFAHHTSKENSERLVQNMGRGGGSLTDCARWAAGMVPMDADTAKRYQVDAEDHVVLKIIKANTIPRMKAPLHFRRGPGGILEFADLGADRFEEIAKAMADAIRQTGAELSQRELKRAKDSGAITEIIKAAVPDYQPFRDADGAISVGITMKMLASRSVEKDGGNGGSKWIITCIYP